MSFRKRNTLGAFDEIFTPLARISMALGAAPFLVQNRTLTPSKLRMIPSALLITINIICSIFYFQTFDKTVSTDFAKAGTIKFLSIFRDLGNTTTMVVSVLYSYINANKMLSQMLKLQQIDVELKELGMQESMKRTTITVKKRLIMLVVLVHLFFTLCGEVESSIVRDTDVVLYLAVNLYPRFIIGIMNISLYMIAMLVQSKFKMINKILERKVNESNKGCKYPVEYDFSNNIKHLVSLHKVLVTVSKEVAAVFSLQILLVITMNFILLIGDLHTSMYIIFFGFFSRHYDIVFDMVKNCITYTFELVYMAKRAGDLTREANRTKLTLLGIRIDVDKEDERDAVIASALKLMQNKLELTACKLFNIDNALLFSICGAASSYLFIMLQLDIANNKSNSTLYPNNSLF